jgi:hypothetical protein
MTKLKGENIEMIILTITKCSGYKMWYHKHIGTKYYFFNKIFKDDQNKKSIWLSKVPTDKYVYIEDTDYKKQIRKLKLLKISNISFFKEI